MPRSKRVREERGDDDADSGSSKRQVYETTSFEKGCIYIIDDTTPGSAGRDTDLDHIEDVREQKNRNIRNTFDLFTKYEVRHVPNRTPEKGFLKWWREMLPSKQDDELTIIYFHGLSGDSGQGFSFNLQRAPHRVNAFNLFQVLSRSEKQILVILDTYLPTRFKDKKDLYRRPDCPCAFEDICCGRPGQDIESVIQPVNPFTSAISRAFRTAIKKAREHKYRNKAPFSINMMLRCDKKLDNNPTRLWLSNTAPEYRTDDDGVSTEVAKMVPRLYISPARIRKDKKIIFQCDMIYDNRGITLEAREKKLAEGGRTTARSVDEGFHEQDEDGHQG